MKHKHSLKYFFGQFLSKVSLKKMCGQFSFKILLTTVCRIFSLRLLRKSHSQTVINFHPSFLSNLLFFKSRFWLLAILVFQNCLFDFGILAILHLLDSCPCQKQPWTNTTVLCFFKTISGLPERFFWCVLKRKPETKRNFLTSISGFVLVARILLITSLRFFLVKTSAITRR